MRQFTMNIDDGLLRAAKAHALNKGQSVSEIVRSLLAREVGWAAEPETAPLDDARMRSALQAYSEGRTSRKQAMSALGLAPDRYADFVLAMTKLSIPWPKYDQEQIEREAETVVRAIRDGLSEN